MKKLILAGLLAALSASAMATDYYVVVPLPNRPAAINIQLTLGGSALPNAVAGAAYPGFDFNSVLQVTGDPAFSSSGVAWQVVSGALPAGLALSPAGKLAGTPTSAGASSFLIQAAYKTKTSQQAYQLEVAAPAPAFKVVGNITTAQSFGTINLGSSSSPLTFPLVNSGMGAGSLSLPALAGENPQDFSASTTCTNVAPGANCLVGVTFRPTQTGSRYASLQIAGTTYNFVGTAQAVTTSYVVLKTGTSYQIPAGVAAVTAWAVGGGGGGAGSTNVDSTSGGGGGAGGLTWATFQTQAGQTISYAIGTGGTAGYNTGSGGSGGTTTITYGGVTLQAFGGAGGRYNSANPAQGGSWSGGVDGVSGGLGLGVSGDLGGGGGGGIGYSSAVTNPSSMYAGSAGATAIYKGGLDAALVAAGEALGTAGVGGNSGSSSTGNANHGAAGIGYGHGGGGAGYYGGNGAAGALGGGGGGAGGYSGYQYGGAGGAGFIVLKLN